MNRKDKILGTLMIGLPVTMLLLSFTLPVERTVQPKVVTNISTVSTSTSGKPTTTTTELQEQVGQPVDADLQQTPREALQTPVPATTTTTTVENTPAADTYAGCDDPINAVMDYCKEILSHYR